MRFTQHMFDRNEERFEGGLVDTEMIHLILEKGAVTETPRKNEHGHWQCLVERRMPGGREACAVTVILREEGAVRVRTVMWKDL